MAEHVSDVWFRVTDLEVASGSGCIVTTTNGEEYLDFSSGIAVTSTGHCHPHVVEAIQAQAAVFIHAQVNVYRHTRLAELAGRLAAIAPPPVDTFFFANSGAEATESAVKLAKQATGRPNVIVFQGSFHGRTHLAMAMTTSKTVYRAGHAPLPSGVYVAPFPKADDEVEACLDAVRLLLLSQTAPPETAAMLLEPVLGEGGYLPAPTAFLQGLVEICREHGILFIVDEVQSGFGRTGTMFCVEQHGIQPDIVVMAKGLASGFPISAVGASADLMAKWPTGSHGGTYGGNPIGCAAAIATIDVLAADGFLANVNERGEQLRAGLRALAEEDGGIVDVRGPGLMVACELADAARVGAVIAHCLQDGHLILMNAGTFGTAIRWMPPLVVSEAEIDQALATFAKALAATR